MCAEEDDKLYSFLKRITPKILRVAETAVRVSIAGGAFKIYLPFTPGVVYGIATALQDGGELQYGVDVHIFGAVEREMRVEIAIHPRGNSWIWKAVRGKNEIGLEELVAFYTVKEGSDEVRDAVLKRITV